MSNQNKTSANAEIIAMIDMKANAEEIMQRLR